LLLTVGSGLQRKVWPDEQDIRGPDRIMVWDAHTLRPVGTAVEVGLLSRARFIAGGKAVFAYAASEVLLFDPTTGKPLLRFPTKDAMRAAAVTPDGSRVAVGIESQGPPGRSEARVFDGTTGKLLFTLEHPEQFVDYVAFSADARGLLTSSARSDGARVVRLWDLRTGKPLLQPIETDYDNPVSFDGGGFGYVPAALSPDGSRIAAGQRYGFGVYDAHTGKRRWDTGSERTNGFPAYNAYLEYRADGKRLLSWSDETGVHGMTLTVWDAESGRQLRRAFVPDLGIGVTNAQDTRLLHPIGVWNLETGKQIWSFDARRNTDTLGVALSPDGRRAATASEDGKETLIWDISE
jgi:WD40 repeat protein